MLLGRGVVAEGAVGFRWAHRLRIFRYEVRRRREGVIPDVCEAVESPRRLTEDPRIAQRVLDLVPCVPTPVWGRDELHAGEMWNSNSLISWLLTRAGLCAASIRPPAGGRAPGWDAGLVVARRDLMAPRQPLARAGSTPAVGFERQVIPERPSRRSPSLSAQVPAGRRSGKGLGAHAKPGDAFRAWWTARQR
jgi:hypothetical protein